MLLPARNQTSGDGENGSDENQYNVNSTELGHWQFKRFT